MENRTVKIINWALIPGQIDHHQNLAPEQITFHLSGEVYGHPDHKDGKRIRTSRIIHTNKAAGTVHTTNRVYTLGNPLPEYEALYPGARERLLNTENTK